MSFWTKAGIIAFAISLVLPPHDGWGKWMDILAVLGIAFLVIFGDEREVN